MGESDDYNERHYNVNIIFLGLVELSCNLKTKIAYVLANNCSNYHKFLITNTLLAEAILDSCDRPCNRADWPRICRYKLVVEKRTVFKSS